MNLQITAPGVDDNPISLEAVPSAPFTHHAAIMPQQTDLSAATRSAVRPGCTALCPPGTSVQGAITEVGRAKPQSKTEKQRTKATWAHLCLYVVGKVAHSSPKGTTYCIF